MRIGMVEEVCCHGSHVPPPFTVGEVTLNLDNMMAQKRTAVSQLITSSAWCWLGLDWVGYSHTYVRLCVH